MSMIRFIPVGQITDPLTVTMGISGASGTGKTYSALLIARGMAEGATGKKGAPVGYVDTENRRALHYKKDFPEMVHYDMKAVDENGEMVGFGPDRWIEVIDAAEGAGISVLVIDSFSHAWEGVGGVLDLHARELDRLVEEAQKRAGGRDVDPARFSQLAWAAVKPRYRRLIDRIVRAQCNIIICTRAKPVMQTGYGQNQKNARKTKTRREDVPWDPAADGDLMFEMTAMMILDPSAPGCPVHQIKCADQFKNLFDPRRPMNVETGRAMTAWARGEGDAQAEKKLMDEARTVARRGTAAFFEWWASDETKPRRGALKPIMDELESLAKRADAETKSDDDLPFEVDRPSEDELAKAEAEAAAAIQDQYREAEAVS